MFRITRENHAGSLARVTGDFSIDPLSDDERLAWSSALLLADTLRTLVSAAVAPETGLSSADFLVLNRLKAAPEYRMEGLKALAAKLDWSPSRLSHHLKRMKTRGLVELAHAADGQLVVNATDEAVRIMEKATALHAQAVRRHLLSQASADELRVVVELAKRIRGSHQ